MSGVKAWLRSELHCSCSTKQRTSKSLEGSVRKPPHLGLWDCRLDWWDCRLDLLVSKLQRSTQSQNSLTWAAAQIRDLHSV